MENRTQKEAQNTRKNTHVQEKQPVNRQNPGKRLRPIQKGEDRYAERAPRKKQETKRVKQSKDREQRKVDPQLDRPMPETAKRNSRSVMKRETVLDSSTPTRWRRETDRSISINKNQVPNQNETDNQNRNANVRQHRTQSRSITPNISQPRNSATPRPNLPYRNNINPNPSLEIKQGPLGNLPYLAQQVNLSMPQKQNKLSSLDRRPNFLTNHSQPQINRGLRGMAPGSLRGDREVISRSKVGLREMCNQMGMQGGNFPVMMGGMDHQRNIMAQMGHTMGHNIGRFNNMGHLGGMGMMSQMGQMGQMGQLNQMGQMGMMGGRMGSNSLHLQNPNMMSQISINQSESMLRNPRLQNIEIMNPNILKTISYPQLTASQERRVKKEMKEKERLRFENERIENNMRESIEMIELGQFKKYKRLLGYLINLFVQGDINSEYLSLNEDELQILKIIIYRKFKKHVNINLETHGLVSKLTTMVKKNCLKKNEER